MNRRNFVISSASIISGASYLSASSQKALAAEYTVGEIDKDIEHRNGVEIEFDGLLLFSDGVDVSNNDLKISVMSRILKEDGSEEDSFKTITSRTYDTTTNYNGKTISERVEEQVDISGDIKNQQNEPFKISKVEYEDGSRNELYSEIINKEPGVKVEKNVEIKIKFEMINSSTGKSVSSTESTLLMKVNLRRKLLEPSNVSKNEDFDVDILENFINIYPDAISGRIKPRIDASYEGDLTENDVTIAEEINGNFREQKLESFSQVGSDSVGSSEAVNILLMVDVSGSMSGSPWTDTLEAAYQFADSLPSGYNFGFGAFGRRNPNCAGMLGEPVNDYDPTMNIGEYGSISGYDNFTDYIEDRRSGGNQLNRSNNGGIEDSLNNGTGYNVWTLAQDQFDNYSDISSNDYLIVMGDGDHYQIKKPDDYDFTVIGLYFNGGGSDPQDIEDICSIDPAKFENPDTVSHTSVTDGDNLLYFDTRNFGGDYVQAYSKIQETVSGEYNFNINTKLSESVDRDIIIRINDPRSTKKSQNRFNTGDIN